MNKITLALALGTGLSLAPAGRAHADAIQTFNTPSLSAATFNKDFTPYNTAVLSPYQFDGATAPSGQIESQVFKGNDNTTYAGTYAYAYQVSANPSDGNPTPSVVDSTAFQFNATPVGSDLTGAGKNSFGYVIQNGQVGGLNLSGSQVPSTLSWQANDTHTK
ncbi:MAG: hypothetical protein LC745_13505, partial [Planctomycetia bacterium]|nr:hypothetical protein [Planctomycetia bacterium]